MKKLDQDLKLVKEILNGNIDSFNIIVNKYEYMILKFIYNMIRNKEASEDITQEVFITVYNKLYLYNSQYKFSNWIFQIARNKTIDYIRKYKRTYEANIDEIAEYASNDISPEQSAEYNEMKSGIEKFIASLNEIDRQIVVLRYSSENATFSDIAEAMEMSESAVKRRYYKVREKYKELSNYEEKRCGK